MMRIPIRMQRTESGSTYARPPVQDPEVYQPQRGPPEGSLATPARACVDHLNDGIVGELRVAPSHARVAVAQDRLHDPLARVAEEVCHRAVARALVEADAHAHLRTGPRLDLAQRSVAPAAVGVHNARGKELLYYIEP